MTITVNDMLCYMTADVAQMKVERVKTHPAAGGAYLLKAEGKRRHEMPFLDFDFGSKLIGYVYSTEKIASSVVHVVGDVYLFVEVTAGLQSDGKPSGTESKSTTTIQIHSQVQLSAVEALFIKSGAISRENLLSLLGPSMVREYKRNGVDPFTLTRTKEEHVGLLDERETRNDLEDNREDATLIQAPHTSA